MKLFLEEYSYFHEKYVHIYCKLRKIKTKLSPEKSRMFLSKIISPHCVRRPTFHFPKIKIEQPIKRQLRKQTLIFRPIQKNLQPNLASQRFQQEFISSKAIFIFYFFQHVSKFQYFFSNLNSNCPNLLDMRNLQEQVEKNILLPKIVLTFHCLNKLF